MGKRNCAATLEPEMSGVELAALEKWIASASLKGKHLEVGTAAGGTLCHLMKQYSGDTRPPFAVVDTMVYFSDQLKVVQANLTANGLHPEDVDFRIMSSAEAYSAAVAINERFDFILIDASHKISSVMDDLRWLRLLNTGGIACFHDYAPRFKGVRWPIDRFLHKYPHFERLGLSGTLLGITRTKEVERMEVTHLDRLWAQLWSPLLQLDRGLRKRFTGKR